MADSQDTAFTAEDFREAEKHEVLGPAYFAARRMAEGLMQGVEAEPLQKAAEVCADHLRDKLYEYIEDYIRTDLELNLQGYMYRMVDDSVNALLTGQEWAMKRYPFASNRDGEEVRAAVAKHGGDSLLMKRITDLEAEIDRLKQSLEWARRSY